MKQLNINVSRLRGAKKILFPMMVAAQCYTEAIYVLCDQARTPPCLSLLRSVCDNFIKAKFLYCHPSKHCYVIFLDGLEEKRKQQNSALEFLKNNPEYLAEAGFSINELSGALEQVKLQEMKTKATIENYSGETISGTLKMAQYVDKHNKGKRRKSASLEWIYILIFRHLSSATHINFLHYEEFFKVEGDEIVVLLSGNPDDVHIRVQLAEFLYKEMLSMFLRVFKSPLIKSLKEIH